MARPPRSSEQTFQLRPDVIFGSKYSWIHTRRRAGYRFDVLSWFKKSHGFNIHNVCYSTELWGLPSGEWDDWLLAKVSECAAYLKVTVAYRFWLYFFSAKRERGGWTITQGGGGRAQRDTANRDAFSCNVLKKWCQWVLVGPKDNMSSPRVFSKSSSPVMGHDE